MSCTMMLDKPGATIKAVATAQGTALTCSPRSTEFTFKVPNMAPTPSPSPSSPKPSPAPQASPSPAPKPSPSPAPSSACMRCSSDDLAYAVEAMCKVDPTSLVPITEVCKPSGILTLDVTYTATPANILVDGDTLKCSVLAGMPGMPVSITWQVTNDITCAPKSGVYGFNVPAFATSPSPSPAMPSPSPGGQCVTCDTKTIEAEAKRECTADATYGQFLLIKYNEATDDYTTVGQNCWWTDLGINMPYFETEPMIQTDEGGEACDCVKAARYKGKPINVTITVNKDIDSEATCSPAVSTYTFTVPTGW